MSVAVRAVNVGKDDFTRLVKKNAGTFLSAAIGNISDRIYSNICVRPKRKGPSCGIELRPDAETR